MRAGAPQQLALYDKYKDSINFLTIYIKEAHAVDEWPLGNGEFCWKKPKTLEERLKIVKKFRDETGYHRIPMAVDTMDDHFNSHFFAWPEKYFIIYQQKLAYKAMPCPEGSFDWSELEHWIMAYLARNTV